MLLPVNVGAMSCGEWAKAVKVGELNPEIINEASGLEVSSTFSDRLYHINDSGGGPYFYTTDTKGQNTKKIRIKDYASKGSDFEDLSIGPCGNTKSCLFIGDIGDNGKRRKYVQIIVIDEKNEYPNSIQPYQVLKIRYPGGPRNAEGVAVHPNGDIYIATKEEDLNKGKAFPSEIFKIKSELWQKSNGQVIEAQSIGKLDIPSLQPHSTVFGKVASSLDISPDGKSFVLLTYEDAIVFNIDLSNGLIKPISEMTSGKDYDNVQLELLPQQESVAYLNGGRGFLYNTEFHGGGVPMFKVDCVE